MIRAHAGVPVIPRLLLGKVVMRDETELKIACVLVTTVLHFFQAKSKEKSVTVGIKDPDQTRRSKTNHFSVHDFVRGQLRDVLFGVTYEKLERYRED